ncbi:hypothetical protein ACM0AZ_25320 [Mycobacteroides abscessus subsp. massiliense]|uniref:hypothetical protein n=1 Tax=Mycobacteroides abscessus TaxID=36809 RepID=UPI0012B6AC02|nr:hypothetical protein [Mycobacteroides abscessus]MBN7567154.1 hypothetical protein [Mycobacteroides abscessus subsp. massiliense]
MTDPAGKFIERTGHLVACSAVLYTPPGFTVGAVHLDQELVGRPAGFARRLLR